VQASALTRGIVRHRQPHREHFSSGERGENLGVTATTAWLTLLLAFLMAGTVAPASTEAEAPIAPAALKALCE
jgi:hypothetical protein